MGTHTSQRPPAKVENQAADYMVYMRQMVVGINRDRRYILNMDQTPVYFAMSAKRMLEVIGQKTIHVQTMADNTKRATVAITIAADGTLLPAMVVYSKWEDCEGGVGVLPNNQPLPLPGERLDG